MHDCPAACTFVAEDNVTCTAMPNWSGLIIKCVYIQLYIVYVNETLMAAAGYRVDQTYQSVLVPSAIL